MSEGSRPLPPKKEVALALLEGPSMYVHLDPRRQGVVVPKWFTGQPQLVLQVGLNMVIPIPDLKVDERGVTCTLSFNRSPFWCHLPWSSIYALVGEDGRGMVWPEDVPPEVAAQKSSAKTSASKKPRAKLSVAKEDGANGESRPTSSGRGRSRDVEARPADSDALPATPRRDGAERPSRPRRSDPELVPADMAPPRAVPRAPTPLRGDAPMADADDVPPPSPVGGRKPRRELPPYLRVIK